MKKFLLTAGALVALLTTTGANAAGAFYGLWWDGSNEQFVSIDPYTATKTVVKDIPGVKYINLSSGYVFDPERSRYAFVGREADNQDYYYVIHAPTGDLVSKTLKTQNLNNITYSPNERKVYGLSWADSSIPAPTDSLGRPIGVPTLRGKEYFVAVDPATGIKTETPINGVKYIVANSQTLDTDSARYAFAGMDDSSRKYYYVIDVTTGSLVSRTPMTFNLNNPVYNSALKAVQGLWWADSSYYTSYDSLGRPQGMPVMKGMEYFVTVRADSTISAVALPDVKYTVAFNQAFDSDSGRYVFMAKGSSGPQYYYVLDAVTGAVVSKTEVAEKIDMIAYAPASSTIDTTYLPTAIIAPNLQSRTARLESHSGFLMLDLANATGDVSFSMLDLSGKTMLRKNGISSGNARIETRGLKNGVYLYKIHNGHALVGSGKILLR